MLKLASHLFPDGVGTRGVAVWIIVTGAVIAALYYGNVDPLFQLAVIVTNGWLILKAKNGTAPKPPENPNG